jgi:hypothetical protein
MSLNDLVASQPESGVSTPSEQQNVMVNEGEQASVTPVNTDGNQSVEGTELDDRGGRAQKRINGLIGQNRELEEKLMRETAAREAIERNMDHFNTGDSKERKLADLDSSQLKEFIDTAQGNDELEQYIPEASSLLIERTVDERVNKHKQEQSQQSSERDGLDLTNLMLNNLSDGKLEDSNSQFFNDVQTNLLDLETDKFKHVNVNQLFATALARISDLQKQQNGPSLTEQVVDRRINNNLINANSGGSTSGSGDLQSFLNQTDGKLRKSTQSERGTLGDAVSRLNLMKEFTGG